MAAYKLMAYGVVRDGRTFIQNDLKNVLWLEYQNWLAAGNTPDPQDPPPPLAQEEIDVAAAKTDGAIVALKAMTPAQARAWVSANVNTLADAKSLLSTMAAILCVLARRL
jgi:hypothetical protein